MKLVGRVPVEPLDDERMTNIERRVVAGAAHVAPPVRAPWKLLGFAAAAMTAVAAGVIGWKLGRAPAVNPTTIAAVDAKLSVRDGVLDIGDAVIESTGGTQYVVTRPDGGVLVDMQVGRVELEVQKRGNRPPLVVKAGDTDVIVVGTHFSVAWDGHGDADVRVTEGVVRVVRHGKEVRVAKNEAWDAQHGVAIAIADAKPSPSGKTIGDVAMTGSGAYEIEMGNGPDVLHGRTAQVPDGRTPPVRTNAGSGSAAKSEPREPAVKTGAGSGSASVPLNLVALIKQQDVAAPVDVGEPVAATAVTKYNELLRNAKSGEDESRAYYGIVYMHAMKMGRTEEALRWIGTYERRFAQGRIYPERAQVAWLKVRILCSRSLGDDCKQAAAAYQRFAPETPAGRVAERVTLGE